MNATRLICQCQFDTTIAECRLTEVLNVFVLFYSLRYFSKISSYFGYLPHFLSATKPSVEATPCFAFQSFTFTFNIGLSDTAVMDMMVSTLQQQRAVTEQLRREAAIKRIPVSVVVSDIVKYINEHEQEDCLLVGFSSQKVNPFREKSSCTVL